MTDRDLEFTGEYVTGDRGDGGPRTGVPEVDRLGNIMLAIMKERGSLDRKWGEQNLEDYEWMFLLNIRMGEMAEAIRIKSSDAPGWGEDPRDQAIRIAAVCVQWLEAMDREPIAPGSPELAHFANLASTV